MTFPYLLLVTWSLRSNPSRVKCTAQVGMSYRLPAQMRLSNDIVIWHFYINFSDAGDGIVRLWESIPYPWCPGPWFNMKTLSYQCRKSHCGDKTVVRSSYRHNRISYTGKMWSLYWIRALAPKVARASAGMSLAVWDRQHVLFFQS